MELFAKQQKNAEYKVTRINTDMLVLYGKYLDFCPDSTRILPGFLLKVRPDSARIFTKLSSDEELVTLQNKL